MMGLRLAEGIDPNRYAALTGAPMPTAAIAELAALDLIDISADRLRATRSGRPVLDAILRRLVA